MSQLNAQEFLQVLSRLVQLNEKLLEAFNRERQALLKQDIQELRRINTEEMQIGNDLRETEVLRRQWVEKFALPDEIAKKEWPKLPDIIKRVQAPYPELYATQGNRLREVLKAMMQVRNLNNRLIEKTLQFNEKSIKLFLTVGQKDLTYDETGAMRKSERSVVNSLA